MPIDEASKNLLHSMIDRAIQEVIPNRLEQAAMRRIDMDIKDVPHFVYGGIVADIIYQFGDYYENKLKKELSIDDMTDVWAIIIQRSKDIRKGIFG